MSSSFTSEMKEQIMDLMDMVRTMNVVSKHFSIVRKDYRQNFFNFHGFFIRSCASWNNPNCISHSLSCSYKLLIYGEGFTKIGLLWLEI